MTSQLHDYSYRNSKQDKSKLSLRMYKKDKDHDPVSFIPEMQGWLDNEKERNRRIQ